MRWLRGRPNLTEATQALERAQEHLARAEDARSEINRAVEVLRQIGSRDPYTTSVETLFRGKTS